MESSSKSADKESVPSSSADSTGESKISGNAEEGAGEDKGIAELQGARPKERKSDKDKQTAEETVSDGGMKTKTEAKLASSPEPDIVSFPDSCVENLSMGFLRTLLPHFHQHEQSLTELSRDQIVLIETLQQENRKFAENKMVSELTQKMQEAKLYQAKLMAIKKEMTSLHEKSTKLKKRALKLQQQKMKENLEREQQREREIEEDRKLTAKRAMTSTTPAQAPAPHR
ncbi:biogenesis of lysosome-related organelles complex 1 subunit 6-like [Diadema setosum]|uniref:biogenesis of lysosome-related organelles complex 1 subunit 6-like n=1 Tax=Diadema setosum TaxID=31175 RepID=UPI003B3A4E5B